MEKTKEDPQEMKVYYIAEPDGDPMDSIKGLECGYYHSEEEARAAVEEFVSKNKIEDFKCKIRSVIDDVTDSDFVTGSTKENIPVESSFKPIDLAYLDKNDPEFDLDDREDFDDGYAYPERKVIDIKDCDIKTIDELIDWAKEAYNSLRHNGQKNTDALRSIEANLVNNGYGRLWMFNDKQAQSLVDGTIKDKYSTLEDLKEQNAAQRARIQFENS